MYNQPVGSVKLVHCFVDSLAGKAVSRTNRDLDTRRDGLFLLRPELTQDEVYHIHPSGKRPDSHTKSRKGVSGMLDYRFEPVVPTVRASASQPDPPGRQVEIIHNHQTRQRGQTGLLKQPLVRLAGTVHVCLRFGEYRLLTLDCYPRGNPRSTAGGLAPVGQGFRKRIDHPETDIVACPRVVSTRVAESDKGRFGLREALSKPKYSKEP